MKIWYWMLSGFVIIASLGSSLASSFFGVEDESNKGEIKNIKFMSQNSGDKGFPSIVFNPSANEVKNTFSSDAAVIVCPNPVCDYITVSGKEDSDEIVLRGMDGNVVSRTYSSIVEVRDLPLGNYILSVNNKSVKFIKR